MVLVEVWLPGRGRAAADAAQINATDNQGILRGIGLMESQDESVAETARRLGIDRSMLDRWRRERSADAKRPEKATVADERDIELRRLQAENRRLREERAVLKKATAFFANESN